MFSKLPRKPLSNQPSVWGIATGWVSNAFELGVFLLLLTYTQISYSKAINNLEQDLTETDDENQRLKDKIQELQQEIESLQPNAPPSTPIEDSTLSLPFLVQAPQDVLGIGGQEESRGEGEDEPGRFQEAGSQPENFTPPEEERPEESPLLAEAQTDSNVEVAQGILGQEGGGNLFSFEDVLTAIELVAGEPTEQRETQPQTASSSSTVVTRKGQNGEDERFEEPPQPETPQNANQNPPPEPENPNQQQDDGEFETPPQEEQEENVIPSNEPITLAIGDVIIDTDEGDTGTFIVSLSDASEETVTVNYELVDGGAITVIDASGNPVTEQTLSFEPGQTAQNINFQVADTEV